MWNCILDPIGGMLDIISHRRLAEAARIAAEEAEMWRSVFCVAVIVIAVLAFILWRKHHNSVQAINKPEER